MVSIGLNTGNHLAEMVNVGLSANSHLAQMVNVGFGPGGILGIMIAVAGAGLYFLRSVRPELARDHDIFFAAVGVLCGGILFFQGWRLDPILMFGQLLLTGSAIFFAVESIRLRQVATDQARRNSQIVDDDRPVRPVYEAELYDELIPTDDLPAPRRIRGTGDAARSSRTAYLDEFEEEPRPTRRRSTKKPTTSGDRPPRKRPPRPEGMTDRPSSRNRTSNDTQGSGPSRSRSFDKNPEATSGQSRKSRPRRTSPTDSASTADYVDYQPLDYPNRAKGNQNQDPDNSSNFDDDYQNW